MKRMTIAAAALAASLTAIAIPSLSWAHGTYPAGGPFATIDATLSQLTSKMQHAMADIQTLAGTQSNHTAEINQNSQSISGITKSLEIEASQVSALQETVNTQGQEISTLGNNVSSLTNEVQLLIQKVQSLTTAPQTQAPAITNAVATSSTTITLTFNAPVQATDPGSPLNGQFLLNLNGLSMSPGSVTINGDTVLVAIPSNHTIVAGESVSIGYSAGSNGARPVGLESQSGIGVASFTQSVATTSLGPQDLTFSEEAANGQPIIIGLYLQPVSGVGGGIGYDPGSTNFTDGIVKFANVPDGTYSVQATMPEYQIATPTVVTVGGSNPTNYTLTLATNVHAVSGTAESASGTPIANAPVAFQAQGGTFGYWQTDANGAFNIDDLPPGTYTVQIGRPVQAQEIFTVTNSNVNLGTVR